METQVSAKFFIKRQKRKNRLLIQILILLIITATIAGFSYKFAQKILGASTGLVNPFVASHSNSPEQNTNSQNENPLGKVVNNALLDSKGDYAVAIKNLKTNETFFLNENKQYETGSLYKLWVMATAFRQIQEGTLTEDEILSGDVEVLNRKFGISPADAEMMSGTITLALGDAIRQMIAISHNYAAMLLTDKVKMSSVENFLKLNNFTNSALGQGNDSPKSSALDIMNFFEKLYKGELANGVYTEEMISILKDQQSDGGLPKYLPPGTIIANKTGDIGWFKHDSGIIYSPKGDFIIVVMSESDSPAGAQDRIALISEAVYDYFNK